MSTALLTFGPRSEKGAVRLAIPAETGAVGVQYLPQQMRTPLPGIDFMTNTTDGLSVQNGEKPTAALQYDTTRRYIRNGRDLGQRVQVDVLYQAYFNAMLMLVSPPDASDTVTGGDIGPNAESLTVAGKLNKTSDCERIKIARGLLTRALN